MHDRQTLITEKCVKYLLPVREQCQTKTIPPGQSQDCWRGKCWQGWLEEMEKVRLWKRSKCERGQRLTEPSEYLFIYCRLGEICCLLLLIIIIILLIPWITNVLVQLTVFKWVSSSNLENIRDENTHNHQGPAATFLFSLSCSLSSQALMEVSIQLPGEKREKLTWSFADVYDAEESCLNTGTFGLYITDEYTGNILFYT